MSISDGDRDDDGGGGRDDDDGDDGGGGGDGCDNDALPCPLPCPLLLLSSPLLLPRFRCRYRTHPSQTTSSHYSHSVRPSYRRPEERLLWDYT